MRKVLINILIFQLACLSQVSFGQQVVPDTSLLPAILDSTFYYVYFYPEDSVSCIEERHFEYDAIGNLIREEIYDPEPLLHLHIYWHGINNYTYDAGRKVIRKVFKEYPQQVFGADSALFIYDPSGNLIEEIHYALDHNGWIADRHVVNTYGPGNKIKQSILYKWDKGAGDWIGETRLDCSYNSEGNMMDSILYFQDTIYNIWVARRQYRYLYDDYGNVIDESVFTRNEELNDLEGNWRYVNVYNIANYLIEQFCYDWDRGLNDWQIFARDTIIYDDRDNPLDLIHYRWDPKVSEWIENIRHVKKFNSNDLVTEFIIYDWDTDQHDWRGQDRIVNIYNEDGKQTEEKNYFWVAVLDEWVEIGRKINLYDSRGNLTERSDYFWNSDVNEWFISSRFSAYWSEIDTIIDRIPPLSTTPDHVRIYPNPADKHLTIQTDFQGQLSIQIISADGRLFCDSKMNGPSIEIDMSSFKKGIYFITVRSVGFSWTGTIIK